MQKKNETRIVLEVSGRTIILVGTAHISKDSVEEVSSLIREENPELVCVELDSERYNSMSQNENWEKLDIVKVIKEGRGLMLLANLFLSSFQRRLGDELGVKPGAEMLCAVETAKSLYIPYILCDRSIQITLSRAWARCGFWSKNKLLAMLFSSIFSKEKLDESEIENLKKNTEINGMMNELAAYLPEIKQTIIDERDMYLAAKIWDGSKSTTGNKKIIAVVGAGHLNGIKKHIEDFNEIHSGHIDLTRLETRPRPGLFSKISNWILPAIIAAFIVIGLIVTDFNYTKALDAIIRWALLNGGFAALGSIIALAHPLTILVSFITAPIATLSPVFSVGIFAGITQAMLNRPRVIDAQNITEDIASLKGLYKNRILKTLLVFLTSSIGGMAGNFIALGNLVGR